MFLIGRINIELVDKLSQKLYTIGDGGCLPLELFDGEVSKSYYI